MPYAANADLPSPVRRHLPPHAQDIYREAFNHAHARWREDERAHRIAWAAVKRLYRKSNGAWVVRSAGRARVKRKLA
jgi:cation transport regulator